MDMMVAITKLTINNKYYKRFCYWQQFNDSHELCSYIWISYIYISYAKILFVNVIKFKKYITNGLL